MSKEYDEFMEHYNENHNTCPVCGSQHIIMTLAAYFLLDISDKEAYKDENEAECADCGVRGICHDLTSKEQYEEKVNIELEMIHEMIYEMNLSQLEKVSNCIVKILNDEKKN